MLYSEKKEGLFVPSVMLCVVESLGGYADSDDFEGRSVQATEIPRGALHLHLSQASVGKGCPSNPRATSMVSALCPSAFAEGRISWRCLCSACKCDCTRDVSPDTLDLTTLLCHCCELWTPSEVVKDTPVQAKQERARMQSMSVVPLRSMLLVQ